MKIKKTIDEVSPIQNNVIVKVPGTFYEKTGNILVPVEFVNDRKYEGRGYHMRRYGTVVKQPETLTRDKAFGSHLPTNINIINHTVYFHPLDVTASEFLTDKDGGIYLIMKYQALILAKIPVEEEPQYDEKIGQISEDKNSIIKPLNGNLIVRLVEENEGTSNIQIPNKKSKPHQVDVLYSGIPNRKEFDYYIYPNEDVQSGDRCLVRNKKFPPLEYPIYANMPTDLKVIKRGDVEGIFNYV